MRFSTASCNCLAALAGHALGVVLHTEARQRRSSGSLFAFRRCIMLCCVHVRGLIEAHVRGLTYTGSALQLGPDLFADDTLYLCAGTDDLA